MDCVAGKRKLVVEAQAREGIGFGGNACFDELGVLFDQKSVLANLVEHRLGLTIDGRKLNQRRNVHGEKDLDHDLGREFL